MKCLFLLFLLSTLTQAARLKASQANSLLRPCLNDLIANLIEHEDAEGHILYEARETFELSPRQLKALLGKVQHLLLLHQRKGHEGQSWTVEASEEASSEKTQSWTFFNTLGNWLFGNRFAIQDQKLHQSPVQARYLFFVYKKPNEFDLWGKIIKRIWPCNVAKA